MRRYRAGLPGEHHNPTLLADLDRRHLDAAGVHASDGGFDEGFDRAALRHPDSARRVAAPADPIRGMPGPRHAREN